MTAKRPERIVRAAPAHWVGDGFPVRTIFSYDDLGREMSPFLLMDHAGPADFAPATQRRGVGWHPHRGFETVTVVYAGDVEHHDSHGGGGVIGPGDVQWMTAASGLVHEEMHGPRLTADGGRLEVVQLWVNLPAAHKRARPGYQAISAATIPAVTLEGGAGSVRVIAGRFGGAAGPARTFTPVTLLDARLEKGRSAVFEAREGEMLALFVLAGAVALVGFVAPAGGAILGGGGLAVFGHAGDNVTVEARDESKVLVLGGAPIDEPIAGQGPFVMNTRAEVVQAIDDFRNGRMGRPVGDGPEARG